MRDKERLHDYRFMPEPNLPPLRLYTTETVPTGVPPEQIIYVDKLREQMPELPTAQRARLQQTYGLLEEHSSVLVVSCEPLSLKKFLWLEFEHSVVFLSVTALVPLVGHHEC